MPQEATLIRLLWLNGGQLDGAGQAPVASDAAAAHARILDGGVDLRGPDHELRKASLVIPTELTGKVR